MKPSFFRVKIPVTTTSSIFSVCSSITTFNSFFPARISLSLISASFTFCVSIPTKRKTTTPFNSFGKGKLNLPSTSVSSLGKGRLNFPSISVAHPTVVPSTRTVTPGKGSPPLSTTCPFIRTVFSSSLATTVFGVITIRLSTSR